MTTTIKKRVKCGILKCDMHTVNEVKFWKSFLSFTILPSKKMQTIWILEDISIKSTFPLKA